MASQDFDKCRFGRYAPQDLMALYNNAEMQNRHEIILILISLEPSICLSIILHITNCKQYTIPM
jgi:hypothetical protein